MSGSHNAHSNLGPSAAHRWRDCVGFEGFYEVSDQGLIRGVDREVFNKGSGCSYRLKGKLLKPRKDAYGYLITDFWTEGTKTTVKIHRLVLDAFVGPQPDLVCDHINGVRDDNKLSNLRWLTAADNLRSIHAHRAASGRRGVRKGKADGWVAYGTRNGKQHHLGVFPTFAEASEVREQWEDKHYV